MPADKFKIVVVAVLLFTVGAVLGVMAYHYWAPAAPHSKIRQLDVGMHMDEVRSILGRANWEEPDRKSKTEIWTYGKFFRKHILEIEFTRSNTVRYVYHGY